MDTFWTNKMMKPAWFESAFRNWLEWNQLWTITGWIPHELRIVLSYKYWLFVIKRNVSYFRRQKSHTPPDSMQYTNLLLIRTSFQLWTAITYPKIKRSENKLLGTNNLLKLLWTKSFLRIVETFRIHMTFCVGSSIDVIKWRLGRWNGTAFELVFLLDLTIFVCNLVFECGLVKLFKMNRPDTRTIGWGNFFLHFLCDPAQD